MVENDEDDTIEFTLQNTYIFRPDLSNGLTGNEIVTMPHLIIVVRNDKISLKIIILHWLSSGCTCWCKKGQGTNATSCLQGPYSSFQCQ